MQLEKLTQIMQENGIVGAGGAGFPAYAKLNSKADTIILNCAECEPLFKVDTKLMETYAFEIVSALSMVAKSVGAKSAVIGIKPSYKNAIAAIEEVKKAFPEVSVSYLPEVYPVGDEVVLTYEVTGRTIKPGSLPISVGVTVFNVETMLNIYRAVNEEQPVTHKYVMVAGEVKNPGVLKAPIGISLKELVKLCGGTSCSDAVYLVGGPMTGSIGAPSDLVTKTTGAVILLPPDHYIVKRKTVKASIGIKRAMSACCSCRVCTDLCPRNLLGYPIDPQGFMHGISQNKVFSTKPFLNTFSCSQCGLCEMYSCMQGLSPASLIGEYKNALRAKGVPIPQITDDTQISNKREYRMVPVSRLLKRIGLGKYNVEMIFNPEGLYSKRLTISLSQGIGSPAVSIVKKGDVVKKGQKIASEPDEKLGVALHSPKDGKVVAINENYIIIE